MQQIARLLGMVPLFQGLEPSQIEAIASGMHEKVYQAGQLIFARGEIGHEVFLVIEGRVRLSVNSAEGRSLAFGHAAEGQLFGEIAALDGGELTADATALTRVRAMSLSRQLLRQHMHASPAMSEAMVKLLCQRLRATSEQIEQIVLHQIEIRIARFLLHSIRMTQQDPDPSVKLELGMNQAELALLVGSTRQTVNSALTALESAGAIRRIGSGLECYRKGLERIAGDDERV